VVRIADAGVMKIPNVAPDLVKSTGLRVHPKQRTTGFVGTPDALDKAFGVFQDALVILHGGLYRDESLVVEVPPNKGKVRLLSFPQTRLQCSSPFAVFGEEQTA